MVRRLQACSNLDLAVVRMLRSTDFVWQEEEEERTDTIAEKLIAVCFPLFKKQPEIFVARFRLFRQHACPFLRKKIAQSFLSQPEL